MLQKLTVGCAGDSVGTDDIVLQIETDKVTVDVRYTTGKPGKLTELLVKEEDTVAVGQKVAVVSEGEEGSQPEAKEEVPGPHLDYGTSYCTIPQEAVCLHQLYLP